MKANTILSSKIGAAVAVVFLLLICGMSQGVAYGANYPTKSIQIVWPFPPGGTGDLMSRVITDKLSAILGQPVVVVNKGGGGGGVGTQTVALAAPDGYMILGTPPQITQMPLVTKGLGWSIKDFAPVRLGGSSPRVIVVKADARWKNLEEMIADARKNPGKFSYTSSGPGNSGHFAGELFKMETKTDITHVPMDGENPAAMAVLGGHVDMGFISLGTVNNQMQAGTLRALVALDTKRFKDYPNVPSMADKGYPKVVSPSWYGYFAPVKTPNEIVKKLSDAFGEALRDKEIINKIEKLGITVENLDREEFARFIGEEVKRWSEVGKAAKIGQD